MISAMKKRLADERGFTLTEMMITIIVVGIVVAIAVPVYLKFSKGANGSAAQANIRAAIPAIEAFNGENGGWASDVDSTASTTGYEGMTVALLQSYDAAIKGISIVSAGQKEYCVMGTSGASTYYMTQTNEISTVACT